jgi:hypothetical protein
MNEMRESLRGKEMKSENLAAENTGPVSRRPEIKLETLADTECKHARLSEIGEDFDQDCRLIRLVRCQKCGLLIRELLSYI